MEHLLRDIKHSTTTTLSTRVSEQLASLRGLQSRMLEIRDYLLSISKAEAPINHQIVYHLQDALNLLPDLDDPHKTKAFTTNTNDQLLVVYLSSLLRAVVALHALVDNKAVSLRLLNQAFVQPPDLDRVLQSIGQTELQDKNPVVEEETKPKAAAATGKEEKEAPAKDESKGL